MLKRLLERVCGCEKLRSRGLQLSLSRGMVLSCMGLSSYLDEVHGVFYGFGDADGFYFGEAGFADDVDTYSVFTRIQVLVQLCSHLEHFFFGQEAFKE